MVELLVTISILGIIMILALPQISNIKGQNEKTKYKKYAETLLSSGKLYVDSYNEDLFGNDPTGCVDITYEMMRKKNLLKEIKVDGASCNTDKTFIRVKKIDNNHYNYEVSIECIKGIDVVYSDVLSGSCSDNPDTTGPKIEFTESGHPWTNDKTQLKTKIKISDESGMLENAKVKYIWLVNDVEVGSYTTYDFKNNRGDDSTPIVSEKISIPTSATTGTYKLKVVPIDVRDAVGNYQLNTVVSGEFKLDNTAPECVSIDGSNTNWTASTIKIKVTCGDEHSGCANSIYTNTYDKGTTQTDSLVIKDNVGNTATCTFNVYVDKEPPNAPTDGDIGDVSGSDEQGKIEEKSSKTTDVNNGSGFKEIRYIVKNKKSPPAKSEFVSTSRYFYRSCGTNYYAYSVAVDNVGNISDVHYLGKTWDEEDDWGSWTECSEECGGGKKYKYNSCDLITRKKKSCNEHACEDEEEDDDDSGPIIIIGGGGDDSGDSGSSETCINDYRYARYDDCGHYYITCCRDGICEYIEKNYEEAYGTIEASNLRYEIAPECCNESYPYGCPRMHACRNGRTFIYNKQNRKTSTSYGGTIGDDDDLYIIKTVSNFYYIYVPGGGKFNNTYYDTPDFGYIYTNCIEPIGVTCPERQCPDPDPE